jgi:hypothetical protein
VEGPSDGCVSFPGGAPSPFARNCVALAGGNGFFPHCGFSVLTVSTAIVKFWLIDSCNRSHVSFFVFWDEKGHQHAHTSCGLMHSRGLAWHRAEAPGCEDQEGEGGHHSKATRKAEEVQVRCGGCVRRRDTNKM